MKVRFRGRDGASVVVLCHPRSFDRLCQQHPDLEVVPYQWQEAVKRPEMPQKSTKRKRLVVSPVVLS